MGAQWRTDQPFSGRPYGFLSFVLGSIIGDHAAALDVLEDGIRVDPLDPILLNNKVFSLISLGRYDDASREMEGKIRKVNKSNEGNLCLTATIGLYYYRIGKNNADFDIARELYTKAITIAKSCGSEENARLARLFQLNEEIRIGTKLTEEDHKWLDEAEKNTKNPAVTYKLSKIRELLNEVPSPITIEYEQLTTSPKKLIQ